MEKILQVLGRAFCLPGKDVDTDRIIPARYLKMITASGFGPHVFEDDRAAAKGNHPFDLTQNHGRPILVVGENFGCGSSREHAVWALVQWGIQAIIGESFAGIFRGNSAPNGLVCVDVSHDFRARMAETLTRDDEAKFEIDLREMRFSVLQNDITGFGGLCSMPEEHREMFITGMWNTTAALLSVGEDAIERVALNLPYIMAGADKGGANE